jgi:hypothetical protein
VQVRAEAAELEELRELKKDIERKEKQQAAIIENQVRICVRWLVVGLPAGATYVAAGTTMGHARVTG